MNPWPFVIALAATWANPSVAVSGEAASLPDIRAAAKKLLPLQHPLGAPAPGDWLALHREIGQTFEQYLTCKPNHPTAARTTLYVQPIGTFGGAQQRLLYDTVEFMRIFFGTAVETLPAISIKSIPPQSMRVRPGAGPPQILTSYVLDTLLQPRRPANAVAVLALTASDLWPGEGWNFVFGEASLDERVGVWSIARFGVHYPSVLRRTLATATHETGHMLSIPHCIAYQCGMNGSNSLPEADRQPLRFCAECEPKIWWGCHVNPAKRYEALIHFASQHGMARELAEWRAALQALKAP